MASFMPALARIALIAAAVGGVAIAPVAQDRSDEAHSWQAAWETRQAQEAERREAERIRRDYERRRAVAHARMRSQPDTMHASRPNAAADAMCPVVADPEARREFQRELRQRREEAFRRATGLPLRTGLSVHPVPKRAEKRAPATGSLGMSASFHPSPATAVFAAASSSSAAESGHMVPLFPSASDAQGRQGFARVINHGDEPGEVTIHAFDDQGSSHGPLTLTIGAGATVHFNSADLENGNAGKGLSGGTGPGEGYWRLELDSALDIEVLSYIRTGDGFLTAMHDTAPEGDDGHRVAIFNPGSNTNQQSQLRLVNRGEADASVTITGTDDKGRSPGEGATAVLAAYSSVTYTAAALESGNVEGLTGSIGDGSGKWRLTVRSEQDIAAMSLLSSPTGHLTNLSTAPDNGTDGTHSVPLFPSASDSNGRQGFLRVVNHGDEGGEVTIGAFDDTDREYDTLTLAIGANETRHFNSDDLELGNAGKGLTGSTGAGAGDWRLELTSDLDIEVLAYIRSTDGFLTAIHDPAPRSAKRHRVAVFNPGSNTNQVSVLRLVNAGHESASVTVTGVDDRGESLGDGVTVTVPAGGSASYTAAELESGNAEGLDGSLGDGSGKWRLTVNADRPIVAMSLLSSPTGHLTNLSTAPQRGAGPVETAEEAFEALISPIVQTKCVNCHVEGGQSGHTPLVFVKDADADHLATNLREFEDYVANEEDGAAVILDKIRGARGHTGGAVVAAHTDEYAGFERFMALLGAEVERRDVTVENLFEGVTMEPAWKTLRRAAIVFAGRVPTADEYASIEDGTEDDLRATIRELMEGPGFHDFLVRGSNDRLLTDRDDFVLGSEGFIVGFDNEYARLCDEAAASGDEREWNEWLRHVQYGAFRAPLELIAHVAENELDYRDILRADYIMANPLTAQAYGAATEFDDPHDPHEFRPSTIENYYRTDNSKKTRDPESLGCTAYIDVPGDLHTVYPHAGILNTKAFLQRYPTTATNRNRARSRWTYYHFLGDDIESSEERSMKPDVLRDTNNPTMLNPACTACHVRMDPVAGAFQNYGDGGWYRDGWEGKDSLAGYYKEPIGETFRVTADSYELRQTFQLNAWLDQDSSVSLEHPHNNGCGDDADQSCGRDLRIDDFVVLDTQGDIVDRIEWSELDATCEYDGEYDEGSGEDDHYRWWGWGCSVPVEVPQPSIYSVELTGWADQSGDETTWFRLGSMLYKEGDTWYRDMRKPGFVDGDGVLVLMPDDYADNSLQWLAERIVEDDRFAEATVKFWWPAIMGREVAGPPQEAGDDVYQHLLLAFEGQDSEVRRLARGFRQGFPGSTHTYNLKDLLVEIVLSRWFRAQSLSDEDPVRAAALRNAGAKRLLTPEELARKTLALTGFQWGRPRLGAQTDRWPHKERWSTLTHRDTGYAMLYGGINSDGVTERAADLTSVMAVVAQSHALESSCPIAMRELYLLPDEDRLLFDGFDETVWPTLEFRNAFDVEATSGEYPDTLSLSGHLHEGDAVVTLEFPNDYRAEDGNYLDDQGRDRVLRLDRLDVRDQSGNLVESVELEENRAGRRQLPGGRPLRHARPRKHRHTRDHSGCGRPYDRGRRLGGQGRRRVCPTRYRRDVERRHGVRRSRDQGEAGRAVPQTAWHRSPGGLAGGGRRVRPVRRRVEPQAGRRNVGVLPLGRRHRLQLGKRRALSRRHRRGRLRLPRRLGRRAGCGVPLGP